MNFCKYKNILGEPGKGVHSYRFGGLAILDVLFTILGAFLFSYLLDVPFWKCLVGLFLLGILLHRLFCVKTTMDRILFS